MGIIQKMTATVGPKRQMGMPLCVLCATSALTVIISSILARRHFQTLEEVQNDLWKSVRETQSCRSVKEGSALSMLLSNRRSTYEMAFSHWKKEREILTAKLDKALEDKLQVMEDKLASVKQLRDAHQMILSSLESTSFSQRDCGEQIQVVVRGKDKEIETLHAENQILRALIESDDEQ